MSQQPTQKQLNAALDATVKWKLRDDQWEVMKVLIAAIVHGVRQ